MEFVNAFVISGCSVLKLSDGRKRSMSLWVEFITASGYLSARKIRSRFQTLVAQACDKSVFRDILKMVADTSEVKLRIKDKFVVQVTPAFKCGGVWPRSAAQWPLPHIQWPHPNQAAEVKMEGFDLLSKECHSLTVNFQPLEMFCQCEKWKYLYCKFNKRKTYYAVVILQVNFKMEYLCEINLRYFRKGVTAREKVTRK